MQFKIKHPCEHCPFRRDRVAFITTGRARGLAQILRDDMRWFACHETTGMKTGKRIHPRDQSHCIGAAIVLYRSGLINVATRLALCFKLLSVDVLKADAPVFDSLDQFVVHHRGSQ
jgi:hypothetical protein